MKSEAIVEYGQALKIVESETPKPTGTEVLLKVTHCGVCHSDVHIHDGYFDMFAAVASCRLRSVTRSRAR